MTIEDKWQGARGIHVVAKPIGPLCNLNCDYCFYLEKRALFAQGEKFRMSDDVLVAFIRSYISSQPTPIVEFVWQGGEPTLLGVDFFQRVVELQNTYAGSKTVTNSLQTNGTLLDDEWCAFLKGNGFLVGLSLDGPEEVHDRYRRDRNGKGSFRAVMRGLEFLKKHGVEFNAMASVGRETARKPLEVYRFFRENDVNFIQFTPIVERVPDSAARERGFSLALPARLDRDEQNAEITPWTVLPEEYGDFLIAIYDEWVRHDVGSVFVMNFEWALNAWLGNPSPICVHARRCGESVVIEHNGDVFSCDHFVYPEYRLGNIITDDLAQMVAGQHQTDFGAAKERALPRACMECPVLAACGGGCPKHHFTRTFASGPGLHYLCVGYKRFFLHIRKYLQVMMQLLENGLPASMVMDAIKGPLVIRPIAHGEGEAK